LGVSADGSDGQPAIRCTLLTQGATSAQPIVAFTTANTVTVTPHVTGATAGFTAATDSGAAQVREINHGNMTVTYQYPVISLPASPR